MDRWEVPRRTCFLQARAQAALSRAQVAFSSLVAVTGLQFASALQAVPIVSQPRAMSVRMQHNGGTITEAGDNSNDPAVGNFRRLSDVRRLSMPALVQTDCKGGDFSLPAPGGSLKPASGSVTVLLEP